MSELAPLWSPSTQYTKKTAMYRFMSDVNENYSLTLNNYTSLYEWSIKHPADFWQQVWKFCDVKAPTSYTKVLEHGETIRDAKWFVGSQLNFAENLLKYCHIQNKDHPAIIFHGEQRVKRTLSYDDLYQQVASVATSLKKMGIVPGDRVAGFLPNVPEAIIAMLATSSLGAVWSSCSPDFGFNGVMDRFGQITPKVVFATDGYYFKDKAIDNLATVKKLSENINSLTSIIIIPYIDKFPNVDQIPKAVSLNKLLEDKTSNTIEFTQLPFDHPLYIMFSSGTTGVPKCIVHGAGGTLVQHLKELILHTDVRVNDRLFYFTTCGWMMWNWLASGLAAGATLVLYDGSPFYPNANVLMDLIDKTKINVFGTSAKYISALENDNRKPIRTHKLTSLRSILSTGSPLAPESFDYVYHNIKKDVQLASISGGTDIISCFSLGSPILPVYRGELQCRGLGMDVDVFNDSGKSVHEQKGELVCKSPFPSMPLCFWNDADQKKYQAAYFSRFDNIWAHGDYAEITNHDGLVIYGRSDAVLNPGGVRIGTAEIYRQVEKLSEIIESIAVGQEWDNDVRVVLFVKLQPDLKLDDDLQNRIRQNIRKNTTPRHVPSKIIQVPDIPRTISGKIVELAVRNIIHHQPVNNIDALANPEALDYFQNLSELEEVG